MRPVVMAAVDGAAGGGVVVDLQSLVGASDLFEKALCALDAHQPVIGPVRDQGRAGDLLSHALHRESLKSLARLGVADASEQALDRRPEVLAE